MTRLRWTLPLWFALTLLLPAAARADVKVIRHPAEVVRKTFDPKNPPKEMPELHRHEAAVTSYEFRCLLAMNYAPGVRRPQKNGKCQQSMVVQSVKMTLDLTITIWLPEGAGEKLKAHEEGHREIAELFYKDAEKNARTAAALVDGRRITAEADTCDRIDKAVEQAFGEANKKVYVSYLDQTAHACTAVQEMYDELTAHGTKADPNEKAAIGQAFARVEEAKKGATTRPAMPPAAPTGTTRPAAPGGRTL